MREMYYRLHLFRLGKQTVLEGERRERKGGKKVEEWRHKRKDCMV